MPSKTCKKCQCRKPLDAFYSHPSTADGKMGRCIECSKKDARERRDFLLETNPDWAESELARQRIKQRKWRAENDRKVINASGAGARAKYQRNNRKKCLAHTLVWQAIKKGTIQKLPCSICGNNNSEAHHDDYDKPLDVLFLCKKHHAERHVLLRQQQRLLKFKP